MTCEELLGELEDSEIRLRHFFKEMGWWNRWKGTPNEDLVAAFNWHKQKCMMVSQHIEHGQFPLHEKEQLKTALAKAENLLKEVLRSFPILIK
jgi:hypothetical protein